MDLRTNDTQVSSKSFLTVFCGPSELGAHCSYNMFVSDTGCHTGVPSFIVDFRPMDAHGFRVDAAKVDAGEQSFTGDVGPMDDVGFRVEAIQGDAVGLNGDPGR